MIRSRWVAMAGAAVASCAAGWAASAQAPAQAPFAIYCRGPLVTFRGEGGRVIRTPFKWAKDAATKEQPGAGECALADRPPQPEKAGDTSTMVGNLGPFDNLPVGTVGKVCVSRAG